MTRRSSWIPLTSNIKPDKTKVGYELMINAPEVFITGFLKHIKVPQPTQWEDLCTSNEVEVVKIAHLRFTKYEDFAHFAKQVFYNDKEETLKKRTNRMWLIVKTLQKA
jgi:hypothetical protein